MTVPKAVFPLLQALWVAGILCAANGCGKSSEPGTLTIVTKEVKVPAEENAGFEIEGDLTVKVRFAELGDKWRAITAKARKIAIDRTTCRITWKTASPDDKWDNGDKKYPEMAIPVSRLISLEYETEKGKNHEAPR